MSFPGIGRAGFFPLPTRQAANTADLIPQSAPSSPQASTRPDIIDIYGPLPLPDPIHWLIYGAVALLVISVLVLLLFFYLRKKKSAPPVQIPPHTRALAELASARQYLLDNQALMYAQCLSEIVRGYIEERFSIRSTRQTTTEFFATLQARQPPHPQLLNHEAALRKCLQQCDMAKYAHKKEDRRSLEEMEKAVRHFIEETAIAGEEE